MIASTFVANSKYYQYPIDLWLWGLREFETKVFETRKVLKPDDISQIQNECLTNLFKTHDRVFWLQADLIFDATKTEDFLKIANSDITPANMGFGIYKNKLYFDLGISFYGAILIKKEMFLDLTNDRINDNESKFSGDGAYTDRCYPYLKYGPAGRILEENEVFGIDVGYIGKSNYINHTRQQQEIWNTKEWPDISGCHKLINPLFSVYPEAFRWFNLNEEYELFVNNHNDLSKWTS